jgi:hypothetical protein
MFDVIATAIGASIVGTTIICNIINATCYKSIELLTNTITKEVAGFDDVDILIKKSDLIAKIKKINLIINTLIIDNINSDTNNSIFYNKIIEQSLLDLNEIIKDLNETITSIDEMKEYQRTLYLNNWKIRAPNLTFILDKIKIEIDILNIRFDDFIKLTNISFIFPKSNNLPPKYSA